MKLFLFVVRVLGNRHYMYKRVAKRYEIMERSCVLFNNDCYK